MRMLLKASLDTQTANKATLDGSLGAIIGSVAEMIRPEAAYFMTEKGRRMAYFFFDLEALSQIPQIAETLFIGLGADVEFVPVMNHDDLQSGLHAWAEMQAVS